MEKQYNTEEQPKLAWNTPEVEVLPINEITLAGPGAILDGVSFS